MAGTFLNRRSTGRSNCDSYIQMTSIQYCLHVFTWRPFTTVHSCLFCSFTYISQNPNYSQCDCRQLVMKCSFPVQCTNHTKLPVSQAQKNCVSQPHKVPVCVFGVAARQTAGPTVVITLSESALRSHAHPDTLVSLCCRTQLNNCSLVFTLNLCNACIERQIRHCR